MEQFCYCYQVHSLDRKRKMAKVGVVQVESWMDFFSASVVFFKSKTTQNHNNNPHKKILLSSIYTKVANQGDSFKISECT